MADEAAQFLKDRTVERSRIWTLESAHVIFIFFVGIALILLKLPYIQNLLSATPLEIWFATVGGILGAYLSVIQKAGSGEWDAASGRWIHILEVVTKLAAGAFFGGIAFAISRSVYAPSSAKALTPDNYSIFLFGLAAGLFEWLIPKMISSYSEKLQKEN